MWFALLVGVVLGGVGFAVAGQYSLASVMTALFAGLVGVVSIGSHIAADALTPADVCPFAPLRDRRYTYDAARAANPIANYVLLVLGVAAGGGAFVAGATLAGG